MLPDSGVFPGCLRLPGRNGLNCCSASRGNERLRGEQYAGDRLLPHRPDCSRYRCACTHRRFFSVTPDGFKAARRLWALGRSVRDGAKRYPPIMQTGGLPLAWGVRHLPEERGVVRSRERGVRVRRQRQGISGMTSVLSYAASAKVGARPKCVAIEHPCLRL